MQCSVTSASSLECYYWNCLGGQLEALAGLMQTLWMGFPGTSYLNKEDPYNNTLLCVPPQLNLRHRAMEP